MKKQASRSLLVPLLMMVIAAAAVVLLWEALRRDQENSVADIVEAVSYGARSEIARQLIVQFRAFDQVREFWSEFGSMPVDQWRADAMIEIDHFDGLEILAWAERDGLRYFSSGPDIALDHVPSDAEWAMIRDSVDAAFEASEDVLVEPFIDEDGHAVMRLYMVVRGGDRDAVMVAVIDATDQVAALMQDESPGYDILVSCCEDIDIYRVGAFDAEVPPSWVKGGLIEPTEGVFWSIQHRPSAQLAADFRPWALNTVLIVGLALAFAIGAIAYHSRRADERARVAYQAELEVRALNEALETRVRERTYELDAALADLNTINMSVAHDVRSPLNAAGLTLESLRAANSADPELVGKVDRISLGLDRIAGILDRLLALSRAASFSIDVREIDLASLARQVANELDSDSVIEFTIQDLPPAAMDSTMAHVLLTNLVSNAIQHSSAAGCAKVEMGCRLEKGAHIYFVRDFGEGVDASVRSEIFRPGRREPSAHSDGLGLGLAIAARIVARHGGSIWVEETAGGGATFCFTVADRADAAPE